MPIQENVQAKVFLSDMEVICSETERKRGIFLMRQVLG